MSNEFSRKRRQVRDIGAILVVVLLLSAFLFIWQTMHRESEFRAANSREVLRRMSRFAYNLSNAETKQREYLLTGRMAVLENFDRAVLGMRSELSVVRSLTAAANEHQAILQEIAVLSEARVGDLRRIMASRDSDGSEAALRIFESDAANATFARLEAAVEGVRSSERRQQAELEATNRRHMKFLRGLTGGALVVAVAAVVIVFWLVRWIKRLQEGLVTMCAWTRKVRHDGRWISVEDYLAQRFGIMVSHGICEEKARELRDGLPKGDGPRDSSR